MAHTVVQVGRLSYTGLPLVIQGLLEAGNSDGEVADIMGGNVLRLLQTQLPKT